MVTKFIYDVIVEPNWSTWSRRKGNEVSRGRRGEKGGRLLISAVVISEIGDLAVGGGAGERGSASAKQ